MSECNCPVRDGACAFHFPSCPAAQPDDLVARLRDEAAAYTDHSDLWGEAAARIQADAERIAELEQELDESRSDVCEPKCAALKADNAKLRRVVEAAKKVRALNRDCSEARAFDTALADAGEA